MPGELGKDLIKTVIFRLTIPRNSDLNDGKLTWSYRIYLYFSATLHITRLSLLIRETISLLTLVRALPGRLFYSLSNSGNKNYKLPEIPTNKMDGVTSLAFGEYAFAG